MKKSLLFIFISICLAACNNGKPSNVQAAYYFDIKGYFDSEAKKLNTNNVNIYKTISHNGVIEAKQIKIVDWKDELALFIASDINKPAWKTSYKVDSSSNKIIYKALEKELRTRSIEINFRNKIVSEIKIINETNNYLYTTKDTLEYFKDSLYRISKKQDVNILGVNTYKIIGKF